MAAPAPPGYPARWEADVVLADGATMHVRPIRPDDAPGIEALHARLSPQTIYFRFFSPVTRLTPRMLERFTNVDYVERMALVGELGGDLIGVARYEALPPRGADREAEVAFLVSDEHQGRGIGSIMLEHLVAAGRAAGFTRFVADTLPENARMLRVFHDAGFDDERRFTDGVVRVVFPIAPTAASEARADERGRRAAAASVRRLLEPAGVAVIGASTRPDTLGHVLLRAMLAADPLVPVWPVHPTAPAVAGVPAVRSVLDIPERIDLAVVIAPAAAVPAVAADCARKGVAGMVVLSAGFAERDAQGAERERDLVVEARRHGMRLVGPASMGVVNTDPAVRLNATFTPVPPPGPIGFVASSGALGVVILDELRRRGLGVSSFVSLGNKADVSSNDLLAHWETDERTEVVCMYIESFGNPRTFSRLARRVATTKPVVAVRSGRTPAGLVAAGRHRPAQDDRLVEALFRQAGVIRTDTLEELFDVTALLATSPLPAGDRVAVVGNSGGPGALAADACAVAGLEVAPLDPTTVAALEAALPGRASATNPVGLPADAGPADFAAAVAAVLADDGVDAVLALYTSPLAVPLEEVARAVAGAAAATTKPVALCALGRRGVLDPGDGLPPVACYAFPESAARALGAVSAYAAWRRRGPGQPLAPPGVDVEAARAATAPVLAAGGGELDQATATAVVEACGVATAPSAVVADPADAVVAAGAVGYPVVLRADPTGPDGPPTHVRVGLADPAAVRAAYTALAGPGSRVLVQPMVDPGLDVVVGVEQDPLFGSLVTLARSAGTGVPPRRRSGRSTPLSDADLTGLLDEVDDGWSGAERAAVGEVVARVAALAEAVPELAEIELNPVIVPGGDGADRPTDREPTATGVRVRVAPFDPRPELAVRRLS
ncbi:MAG TPA: GNAT family N-acetyltransferase [Acidimicrobiales bacterium]|nr:GNAT family N-acetyltransferase [Acidimicrobiales bacterium]